MEKELTHLDATGRARMVDVSAKVETARRAVAKAEVHLQRSTLVLILEGQVPKGDVLAVAQIAGIMAAKKTSELIPMCHPLLITAVDVSFRPNKEGNFIEVEAAVKTTGPTGVEMEALTAAGVAALTIYDMVKAVERGASIQNLRLLHKSGGRSGTVDLE
ncbi:MAG: cyclic pyranopterin monophosphate synthase MoaC [Candidatus Marsarchaeota archaeon]|nr:cyclic pyranopterin monophosphate synthase MoaC [Candidatus Marsarchaeota archaeon]